MKTQEVRDVIVNHVIPNFDEESLFGSYVVDALNMAVNAVGAIDQIQWERDIAIKQLHDLGYGLGEKPRDDNSSSDKLIKASDAVDVVAKHSALYGDGEISTDDGEALLYDIMSEIMNLPSAQPNLQPTCNNLQQVATDTISRRAAIDVVRKCPVKEVTPAYMLIDKAEAMTELMQLPPAQPERKTGRWITKLENHTYECSECGNGIITNKDYLKKHKFCFCCGAKMLKEGEG